MFVERTGVGLWYVLPDDHFEAPDFGDEPDAGKRFERQQYRDWQRQKEPIARGLAAIGFAERALAMRNCCTSCKVHRFERGVVVEGRECGDLLCPTGQRKRSRRLLASIGGAVNRYLDATPGMQGVMVTLTVKNCAPHELPDTVGKLIRGYGQLVRRKAVASAVTAWVRSLEITYNRETNTFHAHLHALWFVHAPTYFKPKSKTFITQPQLRAMWRKQMRLDYEPVVDIRPLRGVCSPLGEVGRKSLREVLKYTFKASDLLTKHDGELVMLGEHTPMLYADGTGVLTMQLNVPLRALNDAMRARRLVATSRNLQGDDSLDFTDDPRAEAKARDLGRYLCTEHYVWRVRGRDSDFFLAHRSFDDARGEAHAMP